MASMEDMKNALAREAIQYVRSGMVIGLGTGSTITPLINLLGDKLREGSLTDVKAVPTSIQTANAATAAGVPLTSLLEHPRLDVAIDGADEIAPDLNITKGRGGALVRERMVDTSADLFVIIVDEGKLVNGLGGSKLAISVEVVQFEYEYTMMRLQALPEIAGVKAKLRLTADNKPFVSDNQNYIIDLFFDSPMRDPYAASAAIYEVPGVVDHGLFLEKADVVLVAKQDGTVTKLERKGPRSRDYRRGAGNVAGKQ